MGCWDQYCRKCRTVSECNLCEEEADDDSEEEFTNYYCNVCLPDHKKTHKQNDNYNEYLQQIMDSYAENQRNS